MAYIQIADMPVAPYAPTDLHQRSRWRFNQRGWGDAFGQGCGNDKPGLSYTGMYPISHERLSDGETPGYHGADMAGLGQTNLITGALGKAANTVVSNVTLNTTATGPLTISQPFAPGQPAQVQGGNPVSRRIAELLQPAIYVETPIGTIPFEPFGKPTEDYSAYILGFAVLGFSIGAIATLWVVKRAMRGQSVIPVIVGD